MKKDIIRVILLAIAMGAVIFLAVSLYDFAFAEDYYVLCKPGGEVNVREKPKLKSGIVACVFFGDKVNADGKEKNGFVHVTGLAAETDDGWIYKGLLVKDEPVASPGRAMVYNAGKVACRKYANGKILRWLPDESEVTVYAISEDWCVTDYGYIKTEFLTVNAKVR